MSSRAPTLAGFRAWWGWDEDWERPRPPVGRADLLLAGAVAAIGLLSLELVRSVGAMEGMDGPVWVQWLAVLSAAFLLVGRRRWPLTVGALAAAHLFVAGVTMPLVMGQFTLQVAYFVAFLSAVAWAAERRAAALFVGVLLVFMFGWLGWQFLIGSMLDELASEMPHERPGPFPPATAAVVVTMVINAAYFFGAVLGGQVAWRAARQRAAVLAQAATIERQAAALKRRAVTEERLRIARELHDVVGHHVSVIGIQAAAARRVLQRDASASPLETLAAIEDSSRSAVTQMRGLLGTLRQIEDDAHDGGAGSDTGRYEAPAPADRPDAGRNGVPATAGAGRSDRGTRPGRDGAGPGGAANGGAAYGGAGNEGAAGGSRHPEPGLGDLPALARERTAAGTRTSHEIVENPPGSGAALPGPVGLTLYRVAQEALSNVARHSTASTARIVVRIEGARHAEVEVLDDGRARGGATSGSGLGHLGIRERVNSLGGEVDIGPRATGGYRVRVRIPLTTPKPPDRDD